MLRITDISVFSPYFIQCRFNSGVVKKLDVFPIIQQYKHLDGVSSLLNEAIFRNVRIGEFGEIVWDKIVRTEHNGEVIYWDYDISPEFAYENSFIS